MSGTWERCERCGKKLPETRIADQETLCRRCEMDDEGKPRTTRARKAPLFSPEESRRLRIRNISESEAAIERSQGANWRQFAMQNGGECGWCLARFDAAHVAAGACPTHQGNPITDAEEKARTATQWGLR